MPRRKSSSSSSDSAMQPRRRARRASSGSRSSDDTDQLPGMGHTTAPVTSKGTVSATFRVPGLVTIPCDGDAHNFTIVEMNLNAAMSWVSVPKIDPRMHLSARITNASEYTLLSGKASVYVDGSFIARSVVTAVSPQESFDCPLGLDPSIRITYHPLVQTRNRAQSGKFYTKKSVTHVFARHITVHNAKGVPVERVRVVDQIPVSQDARIGVRLVRPALALPGDGTGTDKGKSTRKDGAEGTPQKLALGEGVVAQWDGADEVELGPGYELGRERVVNWVCAVPARGKVDLELEWEVSAPVGVQVVGL